MLTTGFVFSDEEMPDLPMKTSDFSNERSSQSRGYQAVVADEDQLSTASYFSNPLAKGIKMMSTSPSNNNLRRTY